MATCVLPIVALDAVTSRRTRGADSGTAARRRPSMPWSSSAIAVLIVVRRATRAGAPRLQPRRLGQTESHAVRGTRSSADPATNPRTTGATTSRSASTGRRRRRIPASPALPWTAGHRSDCVLELLPTARRGRPAGSSSLFQVPGERAGHDELRSAFIRTVDGSAGSVICGQVARDRPHSVRRPNRSPSARSQPTLGRERLVHVRHEPPAAGATRRSCPRRRNRRPWLTAVEGDELGDWHPHGLCRPPGLRPIRLDRHRLTSRSRGGSRPRSTTSGSQHAQHPGRASGPSAPAARAGPVGTVRVDRRAVLHNLARSRQTASPGATAGADPVR